MGGDSLLTSREGQGVLTCFCPPKPPSASPVQCGRYRKLRFGPRSGRSPGGGLNNPLQNSCLRNPMDRGAWWATIHGLQRVGHNTHVVPTDRRIPKARTSGPRALLYPEFPETQRTSPCFFSPRLCLRCLKTAFIWILRFFLQLKHPCFL